MQALKELAIGNWYKRPEGQPFELVAVDERGGLEIQYFDGDIEEIETESIKHEVLISVAPPEDWSGSLDLNRRDYGVDDGSTHAQDWNNNNPVEQLDMQLSTAW
jgi:hypothetical protein